MTRIPPQGAHTSRSDEKHAAILRAAAACFRDEGFAATSMDRVAERAGVSKRTLYNHFPSKDQLFDVVIESLWAHLLPDAPPPPAAAGTEARLTELACQRLGAMLDPDVVKLFRMILAESVRVPELARAYLGNRARNVTLGLDGLLADEAARGRLRIADPELAMGQFWGLLFGPLFWPVVLGVRGVPDEAEQRRVIAEGVRTFLARYLRQKPPAAPPRRRAARPRKRSR